MTHFNIHSVSFPWIKLSLGFQFSQDQKYIFDIKISSHLFLCADVIFVFLLTPAPFSADTKNTLIPDFWHQNTHTLNFLTKGWTFWHRWQISGMPVCTLDFCFVYRWRHKSDWMSTLSVHFHGTTYPQCKSISCQMIINRSEAILENVQPNAKLEDKSTNEICIQPFCK